ncbi:MAG: flagellar hook-length control protein FliK [Tepidisphaeraceae bacterium]
MPTSVQNLSVKPSLETNRTSAPASPAREDLSFKKLLGDANRKPDDSPTRSEAQVASGKSRRPAGVNKNKPARADSAEPPGPSQTESAHDAEPDAEAIQSDQVVPQAEVENATLPENAAPAKASNTGPVEQIPQLMQVVALVEPVAPPAMNTPENASVEPKPVEKPPIPAPAIGPELQPRTPVNVQADERKQLLGRSAPPTQPETEQVATDSAMKAVQIRDHTPMVTALASSPTEHEPASSPEPRQTAPLVRPNFNPVPTQPHAPVSDVIEPTQPAEQLRKLDFAPAPVSPMIEISAPKPLDNPASPATQAPAPPVPDDAQFEVENHPKIVTAIRTNLIPNGGTMRLRLDPPDLGALALTVRMRDGLMTASFETTTDDATRLLSHSLGQLRTALESAGISVDKIHVHQLPRDQQPSNDDPRQQQKDSPQDSQAQREQQRRELMRRMWRRLSGTADPLDTVA